MFRKWWVWALIIFFGLALLGALTEEEEANKEPLAQQQPSAPAEQRQAEPQAPLTFEQEVKLFFEDTIGKETNHSEANLKKRLTEWHLEGDGTLYATLIANDNLTSNMILRGMHIDSKDIFEKMFNKFSAVETVCLIWTFPLVDVKGNIKLGNVVLIDMTRENAKSINWANFLTDNLPVVADSYWQHPTFN